MALRAAWEACTDSHGRSADANLAHCPLYCRKGQHGRTDMLLELRSLGLTCQLAP